MSHRTPIHPVSEVTPEWLKQVSQFSLDVRQIEVDIDVTSVPANTTSEQDITVTGVKAEDTVISVNKPSHSTGLGIVGYRVSADDTISITYMNATGSAIDPASEEYIVLLLKNRI